MKLVTGATGQAGAEVVRALLENGHEVRAFVERVRGRRVPRAEVEQRIGTVFKEQRRLELLAEAAASRLHA